MPKVRPQGVLLVTGRVADSAARTRPVPLSAEDRRRLASDSAAAKCEWCRQHPALPNRTTARCSGCVDLEHIVAEAKLFLRRNQLRPLDESENSSSAEERRHRIAAARATTTLQKRRAQASGARRSRRKRTSR